MITEGAKISKALLGNAMTDPGMTFGFEAEFYLDNIGALIRRIDQKRMKTSDSHWMTRPLRDIEWHDMIRFFSALDQKAHDKRDDRAIIKGRIHSLYRKTHGDDETGIKEKFDTLLQKYKPYHLITILKVFPHAGFELDYQTNEAVQRIVHSGNMMKMTMTYPDLDSASFRGETDRIQDGDYSDDVEVRPILIELLYQEIANSIQKRMGVEVISRSSSGDARKADPNFQKWIVTSDDSLHDENMDRDTLGVEVVSGVMGFQEGYQKMKKFIRLMNQENGIIAGARVRTTISTGFHINIGNRDQVDVVKLLFLMGDEYLLQNYDRVMNIHAKQTLASMLSNIESDRVTISNLARVLQDGVRATDEVIDFIEDQIEDHIPTGKYVSVNTSNLWKHGYIEFRHAGDQDWHKDFDKIDHTLKHLVAMMHIATDRNVYREIYLKKLYKVVDALMQKHEEPQSGGILQGLRGLQTDRVSRTTS